MNPHLLKLENELHRLQSDGRKFISISKLIEYCEIEGAQSFQTPKEHDLQLEVWRVTESRKTDAWLAEIEAIRQGTKIVVDSAAHALKSLILVSAGMSGALLAMLSSVKEEPARNGIVNALVFLASPIIAGAFVTGLSYLINRWYYSDGKYEKLPDFFCHVAVAVVTASYGSLIWGLVLTYRALLLGHNL